MPPKPLLLAFDTSAAHCAVALLCGDKLLTETVVPMRKGQAERLLPLLEEALQGAGKTWQDLTALAVCTGPGNFTGVRIGVSAARGLAMGLDIPAIGISAQDGAIADIARLALERLQSGAEISRPAPQYQRPADAAPPKIPAVVILDDA